MGQTEDSDWWAVNYWLADKINYECDVVTTMLQR
jgi:hypothetical protein